MKEEKIKSHAQPIKRCCIQRRIPVPFKPRALSSPRTFSIPGSDSTKSHSQNLFAPTVVSTNLGKVAFDCQGTAAIATKSGYPIAVLYAQFRRSALECPLLFKRLCTGLPLIIQTPLHSTALYYSNASPISHKRFLATPFNLSRLNTELKPPPAYF